MAYDPTPPPPPPKTYIPPTPPPPPKSYNPPPPPPPPKSVVSLAGTDAASEDGASYNPARFEGTSGPSLPPERPMSSATARRPYSNYRTSRNYGANTPYTSRPVSRSTTRLSMTHAPTVAPAFLRPMSAQRLQSQRSSQRTSRNPSRPDSPSRAYMRRSSPPPMPSRNSLSSHPNTPGLPLNDVVASRPTTRPPSRASEFSEREPRDFQFSSYATSQDRNNTIASTANSTRPLQRARAPSVDDLSSAYRYSLSRDLKRPESLMNEQQGGNGYDAYGNATEKPKGPIIIGNERNWEHFSGNTVFCWGGRLQNTRDRPVSVVTAILILLPSLIYFALEAPYLWHNISPALPIFYAYFFFICMSSFVHASVTDPGILPRNLHPFPRPDKNEDPLSLGPQMTDWTMVKSFGSTGGAMDVPTKYCKTCNIWRPPRAHHCRTCDSCIETQDHHCVWLNNCVGRRNYRYFFAFISSASVLAIYLCFSSIGLAAHYASANGISFGQGLNDEAATRAALAMFLYGLLTSVYPCSLTGYHLYLMARGESTREYLYGQKFRPEDRHRPYDHSIWHRNLALVLCRWRPPTYLRFKDSYIEGDQRFGPARGHRQAPLTQEQQGGGMEMESIAPGTYRQSNRNSLLPR